jgi:hypothetical protein
VSDRPPDRPLPEVLAALRYQFARPLLNDEDRILPVAETYRLLRLALLRRSDLDTAGAVDLANQIALHQGD